MHTGLVVSRIIPWVRAKGLGALNKPWARFISFRGRTSGEWGYTNFLLPESADSGAHPFFWWLYQSEKYFYGLHKRNKGIHWKLKLSQLVEVLVKCAHMGVYSFEFRRIPVVTAPVTVEFSRQRGRYFRVVVTFGWLKNVSNSQSFQKRTMNLRVISFTHVTTSLNKATISTFKRPLMLALWGESQFWHRCIKSRCN